METRLLSHKVQNGPPCFPNALNQRSQDAAESISSPRRGHQYLSEDYIFTINLKYNLNKAYKV